MEFAFVILILFLGIIFVLLEIIVFPGISVSGIAGIVLLTLGIYFAYAHHGNIVGHITLGSTLVVAIAVTALAFRYSAWRKVALEIELDGKVDILKDSDIQIGDEGKTITRLAPVGSVKLKGHILEAKSLKGYLAEGIAVEVVKIKGNTLIVVQKSV